MKSNDFFWRVCALWVVSWPGWALAHEASSWPSLVKPVPVVALAQSRGGTDTVHNDLTVLGTTSGNIASNVATGSNAISAGAFANMSGMPLVIQNTGANVLIQNAVILNLQMN